MDTEERTGPIDSRFFDAEFGENRLRWRCEGFYDACYSSSVAVIGVKNFDGLGVCLKHVDKLFPLLERIVIAHTSRRADSLKPRLFVPGHWKGVERAAIEQYTKVLIRSLEDRWETLNRSRK